MSKQLMLAGMSCWLCFAPHALCAAMYHYVDWTSADPANGIAAGTISLPDGSVVTVNFAATFSDGSPGTFWDAQTSGGVNYWDPSDPYISDEVKNAPPDSDILQLVGGENQIYTVTLSEPIKDPIMALASLGSDSIPTIYEFDSPFAIVSQGTGKWGGSSDSLVKLPGNRLEGTEGHGTIQFQGKFSSFSWVVPTPETWHGFTFGIRTTLALEPDPPSSVPEPGTLLLAGLGSFGLALSCVRRRGRCVP